MTYTATKPTPNNPRVDNRFLVTLLYTPLQGPARVIDHAYIRAKHDPHGTARARFGNPKGRYKVRVRSVTARDLGMTEIPG